MMRRVWWLLLAGVCLALVGCASGQTARATEPAPTATTVPTATPIPTSGTWLTATMLPTSTINLVFSPSSPQTGYYCANATSIPTSSTRWLYRSDDGGMTWRALSGITPPSVTESGGYSCIMFVDAYDPNDVFIEMMIAAGCAGVGPCTGSSNALWRSQDGGASWSRLNLPPVDGARVGILGSLIVSGSRLIGLEADGAQSGPQCAPAPSTDFSAHVNDLVASDDGGQTWHTIGQSIYNQGLSIPGKGQWVEGGYGLQNNGTAIVVHAACETYNASTGIVENDSDWISHDHGATWSKLPVNGGSDVEAFSFTPAPSGGTYGAVVDLGPSGGSGTLPIVRYSDDSGGSWHALPSLSVVPTAQTTDAQVKVRSMTLMPDGALLASVEVFLPAIIAPGAPGTPMVTLRQGQTLSSGMYEIDPHSANPAWKRFTITPSGIAVMNGAPLSKTAQGWVLWGVSYNQQGYTSGHYYLSPLP